MTGWSQNIFVHIYIFSIGGKYVVVVMYSFYNWDKCVIISFHLGRRMAQFYLSYMQLLLYGDIQICLGIPWWLR